MAGEQQESASTKVQHGQQKIKRPMWIHWFVGGLIFIGIVVISLGAFLIVEHQGSAKASATIGILAGVITVDLALIAIFIGFWQIYRPNKSFDPPPREVFPQAPQPSSTAQKLPAPGNTT